MLRVIFSASSSLVDWLVFNFRLKPSLINHNKRGYTLLLVELQNFLNDLVNDSQHMDRARPAAIQSTTHGGGQLTRKRPNDDPLVGASKRLRRGDGLRFGRGRGRGNDRGGRGEGRGQFSSNTGRIDFNAIAKALSQQERKRHLLISLFQVPLEGASSD
jgi:hypothetical protein